MDKVFSNGFIMIFLFCLVVVLTPFIFFLITQQNVLKNIQVRNRRMSPGEVWLQLIPLLGTVWAFFVVNRISDSIALELSEQDFSFEKTDVDPYGTNVVPQEKPTQSIGLAYCIFSLVYSICYFTNVIPILGFFSALAALVCWIIYWVKLSESKNLLASRRYGSSMTGGTLL